MFKNLFSSKKGRGCGGCGKPKADNIIDPKSKAESASFANHSHPFSSSSTSWERGVGCHGGGNDGAGVYSADHDYASTTAFSFTADTSPLFSERECDPNCTKRASPFGKLRDSIAVVKDSDHPYRDFRQSMLQMIMENKIYSKEDLQELLECFLRLNSFSHHDVIVQAFTEIWNGFINERPPP